MSLNWQRKPVDVVYQKNVSNYLRRTDLQITAAVRAYGESTSQTMSFFR